MAEKLSDEEILAALGEVEDSAETVEVEGASGARFQVMGEAEAEWFNTNKERYLSEYKFENIADLQDLDRLLGLELLSYRYAAFLIQGSDYDGHVIDEKAVRDHKDKIDREIRQIKGDHMGMGRKGRMTAEQESAGDYLQDLLRRAREFGVHRDEQIAKSIDLLMEVKKLVGLHYRCDEEERFHLGVEAEQILSWLRDVAIPEYDAIDDAFRKNQRIWIKEVT